MTSFGASGRVAAKYLQKYPNAPSLTLARMAYAANPTVWTSIETARTAFRVLRGASGESNRGKLSDKTFIRPLQKSGSPFDALPEPKTYFDHWSAVPIVGDYTALILFDLHLPFYDKDGTTLALEMGLQRKCNLIFFAGDFADAFAVSDYVKDPRLRDWGGELQSMLAFLNATRKAFPNARIIFKWGNHEERYDRYMKVKAVEIYGIEKYSWRSLLEFDRLNIEEIKDMRPVKLGDLTVLHGHEYRFPITNPVNPARGLFLRAKVLAMCGHFHQTSQHSERNLDGKIVSTWSIGGLCDLHPDYRPLNNWNSGFAIVPFNKAGEFEVESYRIISGKAYR